jgi:uncharacterized protein (DUF1499 family)
MIDRMTYLLFLLSVTTNAWLPQFPLVESSRREVLGQITLLLSAAPQTPTSAGRSSCTTLSDPAKTVVTCTGDVLAEEGEVRLNGISATENGVSTSAIRNPTRYAVPWSYLTETDDATKAWKSLQQALLLVEPLAEIVALDSNLRDSGRFYLHAVVNGEDDVEFLLRPDDRLVLFRSAARTSVFVYPVTQPVSDGNRNFMRLEKIRNVLGWQALS